MTDQILPQADAASEARGADPMLSEEAGTIGGDRPAFDFEGSVANGGTATRTAPESANTLKDKAIGRLRSEADSRKSVVSEHLKQVSGALGSVGGQANGQTQAGGETPPWLANGVGQATQMIDRIADRIETADSAELLEDIRGMARANPALFLGACALAGFVAARVLSAGEAR